jgi:hypothetical protein
VELLLHFILVDLVDRWTFDVAYYILRLMPMIVPDDEEFANRKKRNRCEYLKRGVRGSLGAFSSSCMVMGHAGGKRKRWCPPEEEKRKKETKNKKSPKRTRKKETVLH